jgi:hypothetical protein
MADLRRTIERNEHDVGAHSDLGRLLVQQGRYEQALPTSSAQSPDGRVSRNELLLRSLPAAHGPPRRGRARVAAPWRSIRDFLYGEPQVLLARTHLERDAEEARRWAEQAVKLNTSSVEGWVVLAEAEQRRGDEAAPIARSSRARTPTGSCRLPTPANRKWLVAAKRGARATHA